MIETSEVSKKFGNLGGLLSAEDRVLRDEEY